MRIVIWSGSLGSTSANLAALEVAARWLTTHGANLDWVDNMEQVPPFRVDHVDAPSSAVLRLRTQVENADAVLIAAPEHAGGVAGVVKNALDWLVGSGSMYHKLVGVLSVGTTGGEFAREQLVRTLSWQGALPIAAHGIANPRSKMADGEFTDLAAIADIESWVAAVVKAGRLSHDERILQTVPILEPLGIDSARFGPSGA